MANASSGPVVEGFNGAAAAAMLQVLFCFFLFFERFNVLLRVVTTAPSLQVSGDGL